MDLLLDLSRSGGQRSSAYSPHHPHRYWIQDGHLMYQNRATGGTPVAGAVWGISLRDLAHRWYGAGEAKLSAVALRPIQAKRKQRPKTPTKEGSTTPRRTSPGPKPKRIRTEEGPPEKEVQMLADLPPELVVPIIEQVGDKGRDTGTRYLIRRDLAVGGPISGHLGRLSVMRRWWTEVLTLDPGQRLVDRNRPIDINTAFQQLQEMGRTMDPVSFARVWFPIMIDQYDLNRLEAMYRDVRADESHEFSLVTWDLVVVLDDVVRELRRGAPTESPVPIQAAAYARLQEEAYQMQRFYRTHAPEEILETRQFFIWMEDTLPTALAFGMSLTHLISMRDYINYREVPLESIADREELEMRQRNDQRIENYLKRIVNPLVDSSRNAVAILRQTDDFLWVYTLSNFVALVRYVALAVTMRRPGGGNTGNWDRAQREGANKAVELIRDRARKKAEELGGDVETWWTEPGEDGDDDDDDDDDDDQGPAPIPPEDEDDEDDSDIEMPQFLPYQPDPFRG